MKRISIKVAKAIKDAGYPLERFQTVSREQFEAGHGYKYSTDESFYSESPSILYPEDNNTIDMYYCPTYIEVWLWLWRDKGIQFEQGANVIYDSNNNLIKDFKTLKTIDPEESIITAVNYLVENDLIK